MLDADYLEQVTKDMEKAVGQMNDYLIEKIAKRIDALFRLNGEVKLIQSSIYDVRKAEQAGMLLDEITAEVQKRLPHIEAEVKTAFLDAADKISVDAAERTREVIEVEHEIGNLTDISLDEVTPFEAVGLPRDAENLNLTPKEIRLLESAYRQSRHDVKNFTRTMPNHGQDMYIRLCDEAYMKVRHGVSLDVAICEAIEGAAKQGISTVSYGGRTERAEVAIARAVRTGVNRASGDIVLCRCAEMGVNHVLVSQHLGARVTGTNDFRDHSQWQGKVYKLDWNKPALAKYQPTAEEEKENNRRFSFLSKIKNFLKRTFVKEYPDFIENCGYGEMLGICGINCRHTFTQFYPKINKNIQKPYDSEENRKKYETEQRQRAMERAIRKTRTKIKATEAVTQTPEVENELQRLRKLLDKQLDAYDKYCSDNHLSKQNYRIRVAGFGSRKGENIGSGMLDGKNKRNDIEKSSQGVTINFTRSNQKQSTKESILKVNPKYGTHEAFSTNCQRCVPAFEMRERGYNVTAKGKYLNYDPLTNDYTLAWENPVKIVCTNGNGRAELEKRMAEYGDGARAEVRVKWKDMEEGHVFAAVQEHGKTVYYDPQPGYENCEEYFDYVEDGCTSFVRIDHLEPSALIYECCEEVGM